MDSGWILQGEVICKSLWGVKGLIFSRCTHVHKCMVLSLQLVVAHIYKCTGINLAQLTIVNEK